MAKWSGNIGYAMTTETEPGLWEEGIVERHAFGDVTSNRWKRQNSSGVNDDINISNVISIVADSFANQNMGYMTYVEFKGTKWKITDVEVQFPRLILTLGGVYNG